MARKKAAAVESEPQGNGKPSEVVRYWLSEIESAKKREKDYRDEGRRIREIYDGTKKETTPFNILFSNTETMAPAMYSAIPRPLVQCRYRNADPVGKAAATAGQLLLTFLVDTNMEGYETFNDSMKHVTLDALLSGRGVSAVKYDADVYDVPGDAAGGLSASPESAAGVKPASSPPSYGAGSGSESSARPAESGATPDPAPPIPVKTGELACCDSKSWNRVYFGFARKWSKVPWVCFEEQIDKKEATRLFGAAVAGQIVFSRGETAEEERKKGSEDDEGERKTATVYQIWDKRGGRRIRYVSSAYVEGYLSDKPDDLGLTGFYNIPRPLQFVEKTDDLIPTALYTLYETQAKELNSITVRINRLVKAMKARGIYDGELGGDIANLMEAEENELVPAEKGSSLAAEKGLQNAIWFMPLEVMQQTLNQLYIAREQCKTVIYEIIGIADILRGASKASETLGAQEIKSQWGTLRLKPKQAEVQRYARDILRLMLEVAAQKFSQETWAQMTGLPYLTDRQLMSAQEIAQAKAMQGDPSALQQLQTAITWSAVLKVLRDDIQRAYKVDIETNSTLEPEAAEDKKDITEFMSAIGNFLNGVGPLVQQGILPFQAAQSMLLAIARRFRFGAEIEDQIRAMQPPKPEDNGEAGKAAKLELQAKSDKLNSEAQIAQKDVKITQLEETIKAMQREIALNKREADLELREIALDAKSEVMGLQERTANNEIKDKSEREGAKLEHKKQLIGLEGKQAKQQQEAGKVIDTKLTAAVENMGSQMDKLLESQSRLMEAVIAQAEETRELAKAVRAPRRRVPIRDGEGRITEAREEVMQ